MPSRTNPSTNLRRRDLSNVVTDQNDEGKRSFVSVNDTKSEVSCTDERSKKSKKSICLAYFLWLCGGWCGLHHLYLGRDRHGFLIWSTAAGYLGFGLLRDLWRIPEYVRDANEDSAFVKQINTIKEKKKKVFSLLFFKCAIF